MREDKSQLMNYAMYGGIFLGLYWVLKYLFVINSAQMGALSLIGSFLSVGTPIILTHFLVKYKTGIVSGKLGYWHGVQFGIMLFFFASILEAVAVFVHITWIDAAFVGRLYQNMIETAKSINLGSSLIKSIESQPIPSKASYIFSNVIMTNVFIGLVLSLLIVPFVIRFGAKNASSKLSNNNE